MTVRLALNCRRSLSTRSCRSEPFGKNGDLDHIFGLLSQVNDIGLLRLPANGTGFRGQACRSLRSAGVGRTVGIRAEQTLPKVPG